MSKHELRQRRSADGVDRTRTLPHAILAAATARPDLRTVFCSAARSESVSLADLVDRAARGAAAFHGLGVQPGDSVAVQVPSRIEGVVAQAAAVLAGAVLVPVVPSHGQRELGFILRESRARLLVTPDRLGKRDCLVDLHRIGDCPDLLSVAVIADSVPHEYPDWARLVNSSEPLCTPTDAAPDDVCLLSYTSGTTGQPKGVLHTHATLLAELRTRLTGVADDSVILAAFPSGHIAGTLGLLRMLLQGMPHVVMDAWDAATAARLINEHGVTATGGTPFFLTTLLDLASEIDCPPCASTGSGAPACRPA
jgi:acyl-coenzyme A synthetase/AMP-(fatty) acid ligase